MAQEIVFVNVYYKHVSMDSVIYYMFNFLI